MLTEILVLFQVLGFVSAIDAVLKTRTPQGAIAWVVSLNTVAFVAVPAYWVFGRSRFHGYVNAWRDNSLQLEDELERIRAAHAANGQVAAKRRAIADAEAHLLVAIEVHDRAVRDLEIARRRVETPAGAQAQVDWAEYPGMVLGGEVRVPTMTGGVVLTIPAGTQNGRTFRLRGKGMRFMPAVNWVERGNFVPGNSVPRYHILWSTGLGLVERFTELLAAHRLQDLKVAVTELATRLDHRALPPVVPGRDLDQA